VETTQDPEREWFCVSSKNPGFKPEAVQFLMQCL
jgi:hypothetical protein